MVVLRNYAVAVFFCVITMLCWGSWANTMKAAGAVETGWRFELFYWDYVFGIVLMGLIFAFTMGSAGRAGRNYLADLKQADKRNLVSCLIGGVVFNAANILLGAAIDIAGMSVAFPIGIGLALVVGVVVNYLAAPKGNPLQLFVGVALITAAIVLCAFAYRTLPDQPDGGMKGIILSVVAGLAMGYFYRFVAKAMAPDFERMEAGKLSPYTAMVFFSLGILASNFLFNTAIMFQPFKGNPVAFADYFAGGGQVHLLGIAGGMIWAVGMTFSIIAFGRAGPAISYGLGQGATLVAALWGVFFWKEFIEAPASTTPLLVLMFAGYVIGLALIIVAGRSAQASANKT
jgi:glucose uptake protein